MQTKYNILFIDDNEMNNSLTEAIIDIEELPIQPMIYTNPLEALEHLNSISVDSTFPSHIFVDVNMPQLSGFAFVERFESNFPEREIQIYFLSASIVEEDKSRAMQFKSVCGYHEKPFSLEIANEVFDFDK